MEFNTERLKDAIEAGNFNALFPLLALSIKNNKGLDVETRKRFAEHLSRVRYSLVKRTWMPTFKDDGTREKNLV